MRRARSSPLVAAAAAVSLALSAVSVIAFPLVPLQSDSLDYFSFAMYLRGRTGDISLFLPPAYPALIAAVMGMVPGSPAEALLLIQHAARLVPFLLFWLLGRLMPASRLPGGAALIYALAPEGYVFAHYVMSESLFTALTAAGGCALAWQAARGGAGSALLSGLAAGALALTRPAGAVLALPALLLCRGPRCMGGVLLGLVLTLAPWMAHNAWKGGTVLPVNSLGRHLFNRVAAEDGLVAPRDGGMARLNGALDRPAAAPPTYWWNYMRALGNRGLDETSSDRLFLGVALRGAAAHPVAYAARTAAGAAEIAIWRPRPPAGATSYRALEYDLPVPGSPLALAAALFRRTPRLPSALVMMEMMGVRFGGADSAPLARWVAAWRWGISRAWAVLLGLFLAGCFFSLRGGLVPPRAREARGKVPARVLAVLGLAVALGLFAHSATEMAVPRYGLPFQPLVILLACLGATGLAGLFARRPSRRRR